MMWMILSRAPIAPICPHAPDSVLSYPYGFRTDPQPPTTTTFCLTTTDKISPTGQAPHATTILSYLILTDSPSTPSPLTSLHLSHLIL